MLLMLPETRGRTLQSLEPIPEPPAALAPGGAAAGGAAAGGGSG
jgi:hypothetical protein